MHLPALRCSGLTREHQLQQARPYRILKDATFSRIALEMLTSSGDDVSRNWFKMARKASNSSPGSHSVYRSR